MSYVRCDWSVTVFISGFANTVISSTVIQALQTCFLARVAGGFRVWDRGVWGQRKSEQGEKAGGKWAKVPRHKPHNPKNHQERRLHVSQSYFIKEIENGRPVFI